MTCARVSFPDGTTAIVCGKFKRDWCACGRHATRLCDGPPPPGAGKRRKTCDEPICAECGTPAGPEVDYCPKHKELAMRGGAPQPIGDLFQTSQMLARARANAGVAEPPKVDESATRPPAPPPAEPPDPAPNSPTDAGYTEAARHPPAAPVHIPKTCSKCPAPIYWAQLVDETGALLRDAPEPGTDKPGRLRSIPVDALPVENGNVKIAARGTGIVARVLGPDDAAAERAKGTKLRLNHFATCPEAHSFRRKKRDR